MALPASFANVAARYKNVSVGTANPAHIIAMLFNGAIRFATEAAAALERQDKAVAGERIRRCEAIVSHLAATLDRRHAPELCDNLLSLYVFCSRRLLEGNMAQDPAIVREVVTTLTPLRDAWATLASR